MAEPHKGKKTAASNLNHTKAPKMADQSRSRSGTTWDTLDAYRVILQKNDPQKLPKTPLVKGLRDLVSKQKKRFKDNRFDLDLAYITDRIVAMGFPSEGIEGMYRNPMAQVQGFLDYYHKGHFRVYNLCLERDYDPAKFNGCVVKFPFADHNCPQFDLIFDFCADLTKWLDLDQRNVGIIHCKAGKGRTGLMICAFLCYRYKKKGVEADSAMNFYAERRTLDGKGVTIRSQRRFVSYFHEALQKGYHKGHKFFSRTRKILKIRCTKPMKDEKWTPKLSVSWQNGRGNWCSQDDQIAKVNGAMVYPVGKDVDGSVLVSMSDGEKEVAYAWFHAAFVQGDTLEFTVATLDGKPKSKKSAKKFDSNFKITLEFDPVPGELPSVNDTQPVSTDITTRAHKPKQTPEPTKDTSKFDKVFESCRQDMARFKLRLPHQALFWFRMKAMWYPHNTKAVLYFTVTLNKDKTYVVKKTLLYKKEKMARIEEGTLGVQQYRQLKQLVTAALRIVPQRHLRLSRYYKTNRIDPKSTSSKYGDLEMPCWADETITINLKGGVPYQLKLKPFPAKPMPGVSPVSYPKDKFVTGKTEKMLLSLMRESRHTFAIGTPDAYISTLDGSCFGLDAEDLSSEVSSEHPASGEEDDEESEESSSGQRERKVARIRKRREERQRRRSLHPEKKSPPVPPARQADNFSEHNGSTNGSQASGSSARRHSQPTLVDEEPRPNGLTNSHMRSHTETAPLDTTFEIEMSGAEPVSARSPKKPPAILPFPSTGGATTHDRKASPGSQPPQSHPPPTPDAKKGATQDASHDGAIDEKKAKKNKQKRKKQRHKSS